MYARTAQGAKSAKNEATLIKKALFLEPPIRISSDADARDRHANAHSRAIDEAYRKGVAARKAEGRDMLDWQDSQAYSTDMKARHARLA